MVGGLIGNSNRGIIEKSFSTGNVYTPATSAGGFIGAARKTTIKKSFSTGNVKAEDIVGGFAGFLKDMVAPLARLILKIAIALAMPL